MKNETEKFELARAETQAAMIGAEGENNVPNVIRLMPVGKINGRDGRQFFLNDPETVIEQTRAYKKNTDLLIDYNHQSEYSEQNGRPAPAAGWMTDFFTENGFLCAAVQWTNKAAEYIKNREFVVGIRKNDVAAYAGQSHAGRTDLSRQNHTGRAPVSQKLN